MAITLYYRNTASHVGAIGAGGNFDLETTAGTTATQSIGANTPRAYVYYSAASFPNKLDWDTGNYTWYLDVTVANANTQLTSVKVSRYDSTLTTEKASGSSTTNLALGTTGIKTGSITFASPNPAGRAVDDRLVLSLTISKLAGGGTQSVTAQVNGSGDSRLDTPIILPTIEDVSEPSISVSDTVTSTELYIKEIDTEPTISVSDNIGIEVTSSAQLFSVHCVEFPETTEDSVEGFITVTTHVTLTKIHKFNITEKISTNKTHKFNVIGKITKSKTHRFHLLVQIAKSKTHKFNIFKKLTLAWTHKWNILVKLVQTKVHKYFVHVKVVRSKTHRYHVIIRVSRLKTHKFSILTKIAKSKTHRYNLIGKVVRSKTHKYNLIGKVIKSKSHRYSINLAIFPVTTTRTYKYNILAKITRPKTHKYTILIPIQVTKTHKYSIKTQVVRSKTHRYHVASPLVQVSTSKTHKFSIKVKVTRPKTHKYSLIGRITHSKTHRYNLAGPVIRSHTHKYTILNRITKTKIHVYDILVKVTNITKSHKFSILSKVTKPKTHKYSLKGKVTRTHAHKYSIKVKVPQINKTHKYHVAIKVTRTHAHKYHIRTKTTRSKTHKYIIIGRIIRTHTHKYSLGGKVLRTHRHIFNIGGYISPLEGGSTQARISFAPRVRILDIISDIRNLAIANIEIFDSQFKPQNTAIGVVELASNDARVPLALRTASSHYKFRVASKLILPEILEYIEHKAISSRIALEILPLSQIAQLKLRGCTQVQKSLKPCLQVQSLTQLRQTNETIINLASKTEITTRQKRFASISHIELPYNFNRQTIRVSEVMTRESEQTIRILIDLLKNDDIFQ